MGTSASSKPNLAQLQAAFLHDIYTGEQTVLPYLVNNKYGSAERLTVYMNNTRWNLTDVLADMYPVVFKLVGEDFFNGLAKFYIKAHPQPLGNRHNFGGHFAHFIQNFKQAESLPYLADVAAIEWAFFHAPFANHAAPLTLENLSQILETKGDIHLALHPSAHSVKTQYNAMEIWQAHLPDEVQPMEFLAQEETVLIWRDATDSILLKLISPAMHTFLGAMAENSFAKAMEITAEGKEDAELIAFQQEFGHLLSTGLFTKAF